MKTTQKGFTLIELLIVISIIGILASIVLVSLNSARDKARVAAFKSSASSVGPAAVIECDSSTGSIATNVTAPTNTSISVGTDCQTNGSFAITVSPAGDYTGIDCTAAITPTGAVFTKSDSTPC